MDIVKQEGCEWIEFDSRKEAQDYFNKQAEQINIPKKLIDSGFVRIDSDLSRSHNYEIEADCYDYFGVFCVVMENCPWDGEFCSFGDFLKKGRDVFNKEMIDYIKEGSNE